MTKQYVSVIMCVYNEEVEFLKKAIESIINQTYVEFEFIITLDKPDNFNLDQVIIKYAQNDKRIVYKKNVTNLGLSRSLNNAILISKYDLILRMDADDISINSRLQEQLEYFLENKLDILGTGIIKINESEEVLEAYKSNELSLKKIKFILHFKDIIYHPTWLLKKEVYLRVGMYNNILACEDYDFLLNSLKSNFRIGYLNKPLLLYRLSSNSISRTNRLRQYLVSKYLQKMYFNNYFYNYQKLESYLIKNLTNRNIFKYNNLTFINSELKELIIKKKIMHFLIKFLYYSLSNRYFRMQLFDYTVYRLLDIFKY